MQTATRTFVLGMPVMLVLAGCSDGFKTIDAYRAASQDARASAFRKVLAKGGISAPDPIALRYLPLVLERARTVRALEKVLGTTDFRIVFERGVPVLYAAFSPETFEAAGSEWHQLARAYIIDSWEYEFDAGGEEFRRYVGQQVDKGATAIFLWDPSENSDPEEFWKKIDEDLQTKVVNTFAWREGSGFNYALFRTLSQVEQAKLLRQNFVVNLFMKDKLADTPGDFLDAVERRWKEAGSSLMRTASMRSLTADSSFEEVSDAAAEAILRSAR